MIPDGEADYLVVLTADQAGPHRHRLKRGGRLILPADVLEASLPNRRSLNVALLGLLGTFLPIPAEEWQAALRARFPERLLEANLAAFQTGREARNCWKERETDL
jgi:indolepyruvate ferredoxin oxidoreductase beta subunit